MKTAIKEESSESEESDCEKLKHKVIVKGRVHRHYFKFFSFI